ncbi:MBL fold metallo-hydrolase [Candidatus Roizmanbacteria bacterium]|nr:MBL fold metallo-hydrolase [Candidatus Roizmanbacteria bacterium]
MNSSPISKKSLIQAFIFSATIVLGVFILQFFDSRTTVVFCDVGQGDGAYVRIHNKIDLIIDAGPANGSMMQCLGKYMPFYDRTLEYVFLSHPQIDHYGGLLEILKRYKVTSFYTIPLSGSGKNITQLKQLVNNQRVRTSIPSAGDIFTILDAQISVLSPSQQRLNTPTADENDLSVVMDVTFPHERFIFTGDAPIRILNSLNLLKITGETILKVPHHGSAKSASLKFFTLAHPVSAVISVGKKNSYGHPTKKMLDLLKALKINIRRTDEEGDIIFKIPNSKL